MKICNESLLSSGTEEERSPLEEEVISLYPNHYDEDNSSSVANLKSNEEEEGDNIVLRAVTCPSCGHSIQVLHQGVIHELPGLPAGVKFDPSDQEIVQHLEAKVLINEKSKLHPLIDQFIPIIEGDNGICYTHPQNLPGVSKDGPIRHFFHRPSKAYTTGTRKRRKVTITTVEDNTCETRWHKTGKTRPIFTSTNALKGYKKILVLYSIHGRQQRPEKTNWIMHQYHLGVSEDEKDGELMVSKVFYQTQPRQPNVVTKEPFKK